MQNAEFRRIGDSELRTPKREPSYRRRLLTLTTAFHRDLCVRKRITAKDARFTLRPLLVPAAQAPTLTTATSARLFYQRDRESLVNRFDRMEMEVLLGFDRDIVEVFFIPLRNKHFSYPGAERGKALFLESSYGQNNTAQRNLSGHRHVVPTRSIAE